MAEIPAHYLNALMQVIDQRGLDPSSLGEISSRLPRGLHPDEPVSLPLVIAVLAKLMLVLDDECLGMSRRRQRLGTFRFCCELAAGSDSLLAMWQKWSSFYATIDSDTQMHIHERGEEVLLEAHVWDSAYDAEHLLLELWLASWHRVASWFGRRRLLLKEVILPFERPSFHASYKALFGCPVAFGGPTATLRLGRKQLKTRPSRSMAELVPFLRGQPSWLARIPGDDDSWTQRVRQGLSASLHAGADLPSLSESSRQLSVSPQTLRRRLIEEGTSFQGIKDDLRSELAVQKLAEGELSVTEIAVRLGYREPASFTRAFQRWSGLSPDEFRRSWRTGSGPSIATRRPSASRHK